VGLIVYDVAAAAAAAAVPKCRSRVACVPA
jgi:hypothetical protein